MSDVQKVKPNQIVDVQAQRIVEFLTSVGLPADNIIASAAEREIIGSNLGAFIENLAPEIKKDARYLSKFVVGAGYGLFDYSLNAIWNEVVLDLRKKAIFYGIDIFFDAAVGGGNSRHLYTTEEDLGSIKDSVLLDTCRKLELIADTTYSKLKHILDMRNNIGISHPTNYNINAFELLGWLQTCVSDVLNDRPTEAALKMQAFISNLKKSVNVIDAVTQKTIEQRINDLPSHFTGNILRTIFGIFVASDTDATVRKNISIIAPSVWEACLDEPRKKLGVVLEGYKANLHQDKYSLGEQFFEIVNGNSYRSTSEKLIILNELLIQLNDKHHAYDNYHHEVPIARGIASYIPDAGAIIPSLSESLFRTILLCRVGNGYSYCNGVSPGGRQYYDQILSFAGDQFAAIVMAQLNHYEIRSRLAKATCRTQARLALEAVKVNVINPRLMECLDYLTANIEAGETCAWSSEFKRLSAGHIAW